jgi:hypothetical protein
VNDARDPKAKREDDRKKELEPLPAKQNGERGEKKGEKIPHGVGECFHSLRPSTRMGSR